MKIFNSLDQLKLKAGVLTIGNFDGLHLGHRHLIAEVVGEARCLGLPAVVLTFDPHPSQVLRPQHPVPRLFSRRDLEEQLSSCEVDVLVIEHFTVEFSQLAPRRFIEMVTAAIHPRVLWVGHDFVFGRDKSGSIDSLIEMAGTFGFEVKKLMPYLLDGEVVSSSAIRNLVTEGAVEKATRWLGREFYVEGMVVTGDGRGEKIGFPTANIRVDGDLVPGIGVYATVLHCDGQRWPSVTNVGRKPTFHAEHAVTVEVHAWDCKVNFLGRPVRLEFHQRIRSELKFPSARELIEQIHADVEQAKRFLAGHSELFGKRRP